MRLTRQEILDAMESFPLHRQFGFELVEHAQGSCHARCTIGEAHINFGGVLHGGVLYLLLDVAAFCAAVTVLPEGFNATTHDIHVSVMRPTRRDAVLDLRATVRKRGRTVYFIDVEGTVDGVLMASARVTKSLVPLAAVSGSLEVLT